MSDEYVFELRGVRHSYGDGFNLAIDDLHIDRGRVTVVEGGNGSGKTTLLRILNGLLFPDAGTMRYRGRPAASDQYEQLRRESVLVHQSACLFVGTVFRNVAYALKIRKTPRVLLRSRASEALHAVGLRGFEKRRAHHLSGGQQRRVAIARALALDPEIMLLDEPTGDIDRESVNLVERIVADFTRRGKTIVLSSHDSSFTYRVCDAVVHLQAGKRTPQQVNIFKGSVEATDGQFTYFQSGDRILKCPAREGTFVSAVLPLNDVILSQAPVRTSAQNQFEGVLTELRQVGNRFLARVDCGLPVEAYVTGYSIRQFSLGVGARLYVTFKASSLQLY